jgi:hypothetical protein
VVGLPCEEGWELEDFGFVCVAPLRLGGLRGKKSTPIVGWEVPVNSQELASRRSEGAPLLGKTFIFVGFRYGIFIGFCNFNKLILHI